MGPQSFPEGTGAVYCHEHHAIPTMCTTSVLVVAKEWLSVQVWMQHGHRAVVSTQMHVRHVAMGSKEETGLGPRTGQSFYNAMVAKLQEVPKFSI